MIIAAVLLAIFVLAVWRRQAEHERRLRAERERFLANVRDFER